MSLYIGKDNSNNPILHLTGGSHTKSELTSGQQSDTIFHSSNTYLAYTNTGESGIVTPNSSNIYKFSVTFSSTVATYISSGKAVVILFKIAGNPYYQLSYSSTGSFYTTSISSSNLVIDVSTNTARAYLTIESVKALVFSERVYNFSTILLNNSGIFLDTTNVLVSNYALATSTIHNPVDVNLQISNSLFLQLYNTSNSWLSGIKVESNINTISRNSTYGYIPILTPTKKLTSISKYTINSSSHNNLGVVTGMFSTTLVPNASKKYMTVLKCYDDLGSKYIYFNCLLEGTSETRLITYGNGNNPTVNMGIKLNSNGTITCIFFFRGFGSFPDVINNRIINTTGYIYEFN